MNLKAFALGFALALPFAIMPTATAAPAPLVADVSLVSGTPTGYMEPTQVNWTFSGKEGQYPRLNVIFTCWTATPEDLANLDNYDYPVGPQGYPFGADILLAQFHWLHWDNLYPGSGTVTFDPGGWHRWDEFPGTDAICAATLNDWQTQKNSSKPPRMHDTVRWFVDDPRS